MIDAKLRTVWDVFMRPEGPAPKGQENLAQGLPWVSRNKRFAS